MSLNGALVEYVDYSIDWMERNQVESSDLSLGQNSLILEEEK